MNLNQISAMMADREYLFYMANEISTQTARIEDRIKKNKRILDWDWKSKLDFFKENHEISPDVLKLAEAFTATGQLPRIVWDSEFKIISVSQKFLDELGYEKDDLIGEYIIDPKGNSKFIVGKFVKEAISAVTKNMANGVEMIAETDNEWVAKDGSHHPILWFKGFNHTEIGIGSTECEFKIRKSWFRSLCAFLKKCFG